ncbi:small GTPase LIP1-like isoform X1 [Mangifera indica]|uniref:small GTPase LIP1-like isoform X1 n=1 Tax=Mangifera indica TaxID=29780 RepID=UPI001CFB5770|nr:small GTPase LIP1-like isoform X1 [Mangifera indica]XP_044489162.1 small GTPase LIP1-like isoform X1 [Mangifera indica]
MFWRQRENNNKEQNGGPSCGQVRVLVVGDSGVGKTSLVHLILNGSSVAWPPQTIGCTVGVKVVHILQQCFELNSYCRRSNLLKVFFPYYLFFSFMQHITYGNTGGSSNSIKGDSERDFFIELWDVSGHERYKDCRSLFYSQINGVIFVHDLSQRRTKTSLQKWAAEIAATGSFSAPLGSGGPGGLPVPYIVIGNKADIAPKVGTGGSSGNFVDVARHWVEKQGLLSSSEELPLTESFPGSGSLLSAAKGARYDREALLKFFRTLIRRRYFSDDLPASNSWFILPVHRSVQRFDENFSNEEKSYTTESDPFRYNMVPPLPAQHNLTPPPTLYPQQPVLVLENYSLPRFSLSSSQEISSTARSKCTDINV